MLSVLVFIQRHVGTKIMSVWAEYDPSGKINPVEF